MKKSKKKVNLREPEDAHNTLKQNYLDYFYSCMTIFERTKTLTWIYMCGYYVQVQALCFDKLIEGMDSGTLLTPEKKELLLYSKYLLVHPIFESEDSSYVQAFLVGYFALQLLMVALVGLFFLEIHNFHAKNPGVKYKLKQQGVVSLLISFFFNVFPYLLAIPVVNLSMQAIRDGVWEPLAYLNIIISQTIANFQGFHEFSLNFQSKDKCNRRSGIGLLIMITEPLIVNGLFFIVAPGVFFSIGCIVIGTKVIFQQFSPMFITIEGNQIYYILNTCCFTNIVVSLLIIFDVLQTDPILSFLVFTLLGLKIG